MAIGNQTTYSTSSLNAELGQRSIATHNEMAANVEFFERIKSLGVGGLQALGFSAAEAAQFFATANYLNTIGKVWFGDIGTDPFNFDDATAIAR